MLGSGLPAPRPETMADVPGVCEVSLTRAVVLYREGQDRSGGGGNVRDMGLAVVLDGRVPSRARAIDLGSGELRVLDLGSELVVLDWVYGPTLDHLGGLLSGGADDPGQQARLQGYCGEVARSVIERSGFGPLTRSPLLRLAFRDLALDLDPHEHAAVRVLLGPGRVARIHLDADHVRLQVRTASSHPDDALEQALGEAFPTFELRRVPPQPPEGTVGYRVLLPVPASLPELRATLERVQRGLTRILGRFEPDRLRNVERQLRTFGARDSLARLSIRDPRGGSEPLGRGAAAPEAVH